MKVQIVVLVVAVAVTSTLSGKVLYGEAVPPLEKSDVTGIRSEILSVPVKPRAGSILIVNGEETAPGEFPHQVSLQIRVGANIYHQCGGTIFDETTIILAAHCVEGRRVADLRIVAGDHDLYTLDGLEQFRNVSSYIFNPSYDSPTIDNDTAIVKLERPLEFNDRVQPLQLAESDPADEATGQCTVIGWGNMANDGGSLIPERLQKTQLNIVDRQTCLTAYADYNKITEGMLCAGGHDGRSACNGDSGGPLICTNKAGQNYLAGIVSWGVTPCGFDGFPSVFANVAHYRSWFDAWI